MKLEINATNNAFWIVILDDSIKFYGFLQALAQQIVFMNDGIIC